MTPRTVAGQALPSMGFSRQEYWSRLPFPPPGDLPDPRIEPLCPALAGESFTTALPRKPRIPSYETPNRTEIMLEGAGMESLDHHLLPPLDPLCLQAHSVLFISTL